MTNYEKIKCMSIEEIAELFYNCFNCALCPANIGTCQYGVRCKERLAAWLESEVEA